MVAKTEETMPLLALVACAAALLAASPSASAQDWPAHPVKIIVGFAPGSSADQLARLVGQGLSTTF
jgi:tripartite-type tricarboxylate transporter receptor subunit TctC